MSWYAASSRVSPSRRSLGVTGSGKTFTAANVIARLGKPTLCLATTRPRRTALCGVQGVLPRQRCRVLRLVLRLLSAEAYIAASDTFIEKDMAINAEIEKLRLRATASLLSGREGCHRHLLRLVPLWYGRTQGL